MLSVTRSGYARDTFICQVKRFVHVKLNANVQWDPSDQTDSGFDFQETIKKSDNSMCEQED